jgi:hypothetical protein
MITHRRPKGSIESVRNLGCHDEVTSASRRVRGSALLGQDADARSEIFLRLRTAYTQSHIVHGSSSPSEVRLGFGRIPFHQFVDAVA